MPQNRFAQNGKTIWLVTGVIAGICITYFLPSEPAQAITNDRSANFAMMTVPLSVIDITEAVFVLDFATGNLRGSVLSPTNGNFTVFYERNITGDFQLNAGVGNPKYALVAGNNPIVAQGNIPLSSGVIYVGELTSGKVNAYVFPYQPNNRGSAKSGLQIVDSFPFRDASL